MSELEARRLFEKIAGEVDDGLPLLERFGYRFVMDLDDVVSIEPPEGKSLADLTALLEQHLATIFHELIQRRADLKRQFFGGPLHGHSTWPRISAFNLHCVSGGEVVHYHYFHVHHVARGRWAAYAVDREERALYVGERTTKQAAKRLALEKIESFYV